MNTKITFKTFWLLICIIVLTNTVNAQKTKSNSLSEKDDNFYEIVKQERQKLSSAQNKSSVSTKAAKKTNEKAVKQLERWVYAWKDRVNLDGTFPSGANQSEYRKEILKSSKASKQPAGGEWTQVGPVANPAINSYAAFPGKGRINVVAEDPTNTQILYAGSAAGGIWKTTDGGLTWAAKSDDLAGLGVTDILVDPNNTSIIYMATGDEDAMHISSIGLFKSMNGGDSWSPTGLTFSLSDNEYIRDIEFAPNNSSIIYALTNNEIKKSTNSGVTWSDITTSPNYNGDYFQTIIFDPNNSKEIIVSDIWGGLWYSLHGGRKFTEHPVLNGVSQNKLKLVTTANDTDFFYAIGTETVEVNGEYTTTNEFRKYRFAMDYTAADLVSATAITGFNSQGGYNICIAVSPTNKNNIIIGGVRGYKSTDNGASFSVLLNPYNNPPGVGFYVHPDHHHLSFLADGVTVLNGHDGGVHRGSFTGSPVWTDLSPGLVITQPYNIAITQSASGDDFMMANQDNDGFSKVLKDGTRQWVSAVAGDGTSTGIDYNTPDTRYLGGTYGALYRSDDGYASSYDSATRILRSDDTNAAFVSPMVVHPTTPTTIYAADGDVKISTDRGVNFTALNSGLTKVDFLDVTTNNTSTRIYALGLVDAVSTAKRSDDNGATWVVVTPPFGKVFNSFSAMPNTTIVYATVKAYNTGNKVYKSTDNGVTWTNMSDGLPNIVMKKIAVKVDATNETLFLGTELGIYWKNNTMINWEKLGLGLPNVIVSDLKINYVDQLLYIGTFGRGMWSRNVSTTLGIEDTYFNESVEMILFPNPVLNNNFKIKISSNLTNEKLSYTIFNYVGGIVKEGEIKNNVVEVSTNELSAGIYLVRISNGSDSLIKKLIVN